MNKLLACILLAAIGAALMGILPGPCDALPREATNHSATPKQTHGIPARVPWTTSRITGTPEPPHPYRIVRVFPKLHFRNPLLLSRAPGMSRFFVAEHQGKMYSFPMDEKRAKA